MEAPFRKELVLIIIVSLISSVSLLAGGYKRIPFSEIKEIPNGKALVYIYRPSKFTGSAAHYEILVDGQEVSDIKLYVKSYLIYYADPGKHIFVSKYRGESRDFPLITEVGKTYFVEVNLMEFERISRADALPRIEKCDLFEKTTKNK